jgi:type IV secretory pathway VirJ component
MTDQGKARDVNEAAQRFAETLADSYRLVYGQATESAERQQQRAQALSDLVQGNLEEQAEAGRANVQQLTEQASRQQEAGQQFARESVEAYAQFLNDAFSQYRAGTDQAVGTVREGARTLSDTASGLVGTATGAVGTAAEAQVDAASSAAESAVFPISGYDDMNVEEVSKQLNDLSTEELRLVRDYEERNKNRESLLTQMDRKIRAE